MSEETWYKDGLRFTCTQCGDCCSGPEGYVWVNDEELAKIAEFLGKRAEECVDETAEILAFFRFLQPEPTIGEAEHDIGRNHIYRPGLRMQSIAQQNDAGQM